MLPSYQASPDLRIIRFVDGLVHVAEPREPKPEVSKPPSQSRRRWHPTKWGGGTANSLDGLVHVFAIRIDNHSMPLITVSKSAFTERGISP